MGPIALTGNPRAADPCALIDLTWLRQFGQAFLTPSYVPAGCRARIATPTGDIRLDIKFEKPVSSIANVKGQPQPLGDLTVVRRGTDPGDFAPSCENVLVLADRSQIYLESYGPAEVDLCAVTEVATSTALNALAHDGITYRPDRAADWTIARNDACTLLGPADLAAVAGLDPSTRFPGFANWSCQWGGGRSRPQAYLSFRLDDVRIDNYGERTEIAGRRGWLKLVAGDNNPQECIATLIIRPAPTTTGSTELLSAQVEGPQPGDQLCASARTLAAAAVAKLPGT